MVVNGGATVTTVTGGTIPVPVYATDTLGNPAAQAVRVQVEPSCLATCSNGTLTPLRSGTGRIIATSGRASTSEKLTVVDKLATLTVSPDAPDVGNGATQQLTLTGTDKGGTAAQVPAEAATWKVDALVAGHRRRAWPVHGDADNGGLARSPPRSAAPPPPRPSRSAVSPRRSIR